MTGLMELCASLWVGLSVASGGFLAPGFVAKHVSVVDKAAPTVKERMIQEASDDLADRVAHTYVRDVMTDLRTCIDERTMRHKASERYEAQRCFIEWRALQHYLLDASKGATDETTVELSGSIGLTTLGDVFLFESKADRVWATVDAPQVVFRAVENEEDRKNTAPITSPPYKAENAYLLQAEGGPSFVDDGTPPEDGEAIIRDAAEDIVHNVNRRLSFDEQENMMCRGVYPCDTDWRTVAYPRSPSRVKDYAMRLSAVRHRWDDCVMDGSDKTTRHERRVCFVEMVLLRKMVPSSYDRIITGDYNYNETSIISFMKDSDDAQLAGDEYMDMYTTPLRSEGEGEKDTFSVNKERRWAQTRAVEEVWHRLHHTLRWE